MLPRASTAARVRSRPSRAVALDAEAAIGRWCGERGAGGHTHAAAPRERLGAGRRRRLTLGTGRPEGRRERGQEGSCRVEKLERVAIQIALRLLAARQPPLLALFPLPSLPPALCRPMSAPDLPLTGPDLSPKDPTTGEKKRKRGATRLSCAECRRCVLPWRLLSLCRHHLQAQTPLRSRHSLRLLRKERLRCNLSRRYAPSAASCSSVNPQRASFPHFRLPHHRQGQSVHASPPPRPASYFILT